MASYTQSRSAVYKKYLRPALFLFGAVFFVLFMSRSWEETQTVFRQLNWSLFGVSLLFAVGDNILFSLLFQKLLTKYGFDLSYLQVGQMYFFGQMAKYIPGRFWNVIYHATFSNAPGTTSAMLAANLDLTAVALLRNLAFAVTLILLFQYKWLAVITFIIGSLVFWYVSRSCWITKGINLFFKCMRRTSSIQVTCMSNLPSTAVFLINFGTWIAFMGANFLVMKAAFNYDLKQSAVYIAYFSVAWVIGVLSFIIPAGVGIREAVFVLLAQTFGQHTLSIEFLTAIAIVYRFWQICHEIGGLIVGIILSRLQRRFSSVATGL